MKRMKRIPVMVAVLLMVLMVSFAIGAQGAADHQLKPEWSQIEKIITGHCEYNCISVNWPICCCEICCPLSTGMYCFFDKCRIGACNK